MNKRLHACFSGTVQGVGFRFTACRLAKRFPVTGFVRNLTNGKVELVAEGDEAELINFLQAITQSSMQSYIRKSEVEWAAAEGNYGDFTVAY